MCRRSCIQKLNEEKWDVVIVGGGATGLGVALEAVTRGYKTALIEAYDFCKSTSSRSTKILHGGVRYLAQGNIGLVCEALRERTRVLKNAPHLSSSLLFHVPTYSPIEKYYYGSGLVAYDLLARSHRIGRTRFLSKEALCEKMPALKANQLYGGISYYDGQFDDARLAITLMRTIQQHGGLAINYVKALDFIKEKGKITGITVQDTVNDQSFDVKTKLVFNATGPFSDELRLRDKPSLSKCIAVSQGSHIILPADFLPGSDALMIPKTDDGRVLFAIPWYDHLIVGTTEIPVESIDIEPKPLEEEIDFILSTFNKYAHRQADKDDVLSAFAGLRPLVCNRSTQGKTKSLSRDHVIEVSDSGLISTTGGKWTTYRSMGEDSINRAIKHNFLSSTESQTADMPLWGATETPDPYPFKVYGSESAAVKALPGADKKLHEDLPYVEAEVHYAVQHELTYQVEDFLARRTRALFLNSKASVEMAPAVAAIMAPLLEKDSQWEKSQCQQFTELARSYRLS